MAISSLAHVSMVMASTHGPVVARIDRHGGIYITAWGAFFWMIGLFVIFLWIVARKGDQ